MITVKARWGSALGAAPEQSASRKPEQARQASREFHSSPLDGLDPVSTYAHSGDYDGECGDMPAPTVPFFQSVDTSTPEVPALDVALIAALTLLVSERETDGTWFSIDDVSMGEPRTH